MNLVVDIGNTLLKLAVFDGGRLVAQQCVGELREETFAGLLGGARAARAVVASTRGEAPAIVEAVRRHTDYLLEFTPATPVPIGNAYLTPATLGRDRLAAAVGAATLYPGRNALIVDFGTAVTLDFVSADGVFRGGCISPGMAMRFRALHEYTAALPLCDATDSAELLGRTTDEAVRLGVMNSLAFEIEGYIARMQGEIEDLCVIFTGGDTNFFAKRIKNTIFANCNLVFWGLNRILEYNASEEHLD
ncbi:MULTISPECIES: type III pantothenate kinase [Alistipes]|uniref:type III pantothenate kinase n=1 Tax=Alistipes TaxID=239759 RepID=UPI001B35B335|nr:MULTISPECIES: type III pantothenate kinase [Alistipes]MBQ4902641.1 type III pantothenate kinase [Alistipes sp. Marseille-P2263]MCI2257923.1 type III pantothenate kinase [Alistipes dispar]